MVNHLVLN